MCIVLCLPAQNLSYAHMLYMKNENLKTKFFASFACIENKQRKIRLVALITCSNLLQRASTWVSISKNLGEIVS